MGWGNLRLLTCSRRVASAGSVGSVGAAPYWKVWRLRGKRRFLWCTWDNWEYIGMIKATEWDAFKREFEEYSGPVEVIRDDF